MRWAADEPIVPSRRSSSARRRFLDYAAHKASLWRTPRLASSRTLCSRCARDPDAVFYQRAKIQFAVSISPEMHLDTSATAAPPRLLLPSVQAHSHDIRGAELPRWRRSCAATIRMMPTREDGDLRALLRTPLQALTSAPAARCRTGTESMSPRPPRGGPTMTCCRARRRARTCLELLTNDAADVLGFAVVDIERSERSCSRPARMAGSRGTSGRPETEMRIFRPVPSRSGATFNGRRASTAGICDAPCI